MNGPALFGVLPTFVELNDLKRIYSAQRRGSAATRLFGDAWAALADGAALNNVCSWVTGRAIVAARLGDIDLQVMSRAGIPVAQQIRVLQDAVDAVTGGWPDAVRQVLRSGVTQTIAIDSDRAPAFVGKLAEQPRAGITCPGKPRLILEPFENHADHCLMVAVYGFLLAPRYHADPCRVFLAGLAHHLHNAGMPDSGFTGEMLLGDHLQTLVDYYTEECLKALDPALRAMVEDARAVLPDAETSEGRAFHAADVLDRVLQCLQYTRAGALTTAQMLGEMNLVHDGPVKGFHDEVLRQAGLL